MSIVLKLGLLAVVFHLSLCLCDDDGDFFFHVETSDHAFPAEPCQQIAAVSNVEPECTFTPDFSTTETSLRSAIFLGDVKRTAQILTSDRTFALAFGLAYEPEQECLVVRSENRERDPDVVAFRGVALNALKTKEVQKLARAMVGSFITDCTSCDLFTSDELDMYEESLTEFLSDPKNLLDVLERDPNELGRRKLLVTESSPTNSFICAYCYPNNTCSDMRWCGN